MRADLEKFFPGQPATQSGVEPGTAILANRDDERVLIVGAGPIGLICGYWLARKGISVHIVDRSEQIPVDLRASTWHPSTLDMLEEYGVTAHILAKGSTTPSWQYRFRDTGERAVFDLSVLSDETNHPYRVQCEQFHVVKYLAETVSALENATLWYGAEAVGVAQDDDHVTLDVCRCGETTTLSGRYLIAADGGQSSIRQKLGIGFDGKTYEAVALVAITDFPFEDHYEGLSGVNYIWTETSNFSLLRVPDRWRSGITPNPGQTPEEALADESIEAHFQAIVPKPEPYNILAKAMYRTHQRVADTFNVGRILLAGDSAHLNSPNGGLGMNCGVHDAINLTGKLEKIWHGADLALFDHYTRQRRAVAVKYVHEISDKNHLRARERDPARRREIMDELQRIAGHEALSKSYLMGTSLIEAVRYAESID